MTASRPGADPNVMAATVAAPIERRLGEISGVTELTSVTSLGQSRITIQFDLNRSIEGAARDVQAALNAALSDLPTDLPTLPTFRKANFAAAPILILALTSKSDASKRHLRRRRQHNCPASVPGVGRGRCHGCRIGATGNSRPCRSNAPVCHGPFHGGRADGDFQFECGWSDWAASMATSEP